MEFGGGDRKGGLVVLLVCALQEAAEARWEGGGCRGRRDGRADETCGGMKLRTGEGANEAHTQKKLNSLNTCV